MEKNPERHKGHIKMDSLATDEGIKPEPDPRVLGRSTAITHYDSSTAQHSRYRSATQFPEASAAGHLDTADGVLLAPCSSSQRKKNQHPTQFRN